MSASVDGQKYNLLHPCFRRSEIADNHATLAIQPGEPRGLHVVALCRNCGLCRRDSAAAKVDMPTLLCFAVRVQALAEKLGVRHWSIFLRAVL